MKYSCNLIRDLLPLYCDGVCSEDSAEAVQEHISACEACGKIYADMKKQNLIEASMASEEYERQQCASMREVKKKIKKRNTAFGTIGMVIGILLAVLVIRILLVAGVIFEYARMTDQKEGYVSNNIEEYGDFDRHSLFSKLDIFPERISENMEADKYFFYYKEGFLDSDAQIYLECQFDRESYLEELERLGGIKEEYGGKVQAVVYDTRSFAYPAYVAIDSYNHCYEYALLLGENRIAYLFLQFIDEEEIAFPAEYLPGEYGRSETGYSIYVFTNKSGDSYCVYSREQ